VIAGPAGAAKRPERGITATDVKDKLDLIEKLIAAASKSGGMVTGTEP
jgi:hypothetical protein